MRFLGHSNGRPLLVTDRVWPFGTNVEHWDCHLQLVVERRSQWQQTPFCLRQALGSGRSLDLPLVAVISGIPARVHGYQLLTYGCYCKTDTADCQASTDSSSGPLGTHSANGGSVGCYSAAESSHICYSLFSPLWARRQPRIWPCR
jgi:hypothetical protein